MSLFLRIKEKIFYGWVIVASCLVITCALIGIRFSFGVFFKSLEAEFGLSRTVTSSVYSAYMVIFAVFAIISGLAMDRYGPKLVFSLMGLVTGLSLLITSQTNSLWQIFLSYSLLLAIGTGGAMPVLISLVSRWFDKKRGFVIGIATSGSGLGTLVLAPFAAYLISNFGWRMSYAVMGLVAWLTVIPTAMLLYRDPSKIGVLPDGVKSTAGETESISTERSSNQTGLSLSQALQTKSFWLMFSVLFLFSLCLNLILTHVVPYATDVGISTIEASTILSVMSGVHILSRLITGRASDIIGRKIPGVICAVLGAAALIGLIWAHDLWVFYLLAVVWGYTWGGMGVSNIALISDIFGNRSLGAIMGALEMGFAIGSAVGAAFGGFIFDITQSYSAAFATGAATMLITGFLITLTRRESDTGIDLR